MNTMAKKDILYEVNEICQTIPKRKKSFPVRTAVKIRVIAADVVEAQQKSDAVIKRQELEKVSDLSNQSYVRVLNKELSHNRIFIEAHQGEIYDGVIVEMKKI